VNDRPQTADRPYRERAEDGHRIEHGAPAKAR
jgi:hypothetical protein